MTKNYEELIAKEEAKGTVDTTDFRLGCTWAQFVIIIALICSREIGVQRSLFCDSVQLMTINL
jgi:hypothetical protein